MASNNSQLQSLIRECEALKRLHNHLVIKFIDPLEVAKKDFESCIENMATSGIPQEECKEFREEYFEKKDLVNFNNLQKRLMDGDLVTIRKHYIQPLLNQINSLTGYNLSLGSLDLKDPQKVTGRSTLQPRLRGGEQNYVIQLDAICEFMNLLVKTRNNVRDAFREYMNIIKSMVGDGVPIQVFNHYHGNFFGGNKKQVEVINFQLAEDYKQLKMMFGKISDALSTLGETYSGTPSTM